MLSKECDLTLPNFAVQVILGCLLGGCSTAEDADEAPASGGRDYATTGGFAGSNSCRDCHASQFEAWRGSHHALAMQEASPATVLGDFSGARFEHDGESFVFSRREARYVVDIGGADGATRSHDISYTLGISPLQQYLVRVPGGRLQALTVAWDTRPASDGGARWFSLYPDGEAAPGSALHWRGLEQNWNFMCADCHTTALAKNYDANSASFDTRWAEISVGCEACHGPQTGHAAWYSDPAANAPRPPHVLAGFTAPAAETQICAPCHSRRSGIAGGFRAGEAYLDYYRPALIEDGLYHVDGQIDGEVYEYGSFLQSKMFRRGVRCSDCHEPHSATLRRAGDQLCTHCHNDLPKERFPTLRAAKYDDPDHHFHGRDGRTVACVDCHMTGRNYMGHDFRRDHSFRIPRPALTASLGVPDACTACHNDRTPAWAAEALEARTGPAHAQAFATTFAAARARRRSAETGLVDIAGSRDAAVIVRATALSLLGAYASVGSERALMAGLESPHALIRLGALRAADRLAPDSLWRHVGPLLEDPLRAIRLEASRQLARTYSLDLPPSRRERLDAGLAEWFRSLRLNADRPEAHLNRALTLTDIGDVQAAEEAYRQALRLDAANVPARINLADLYRAMSRETEAGELLRDALRLSPYQPEVYRAYAYWNARQGLSDETIRLLRRAMQLAPDEPEYGYLYGVALASYGQHQGAIGQWLEIHRRFPEHEDTLYALSTLYRDQSEFGLAREFAARLVALAPRESRYRELLRTLPVN